MELAGLPFKVIGKDAKSLLQGRDSYQENPNSDYQAVSNLAKRDDISYVSTRVELGPGESRDILLTIPPDAGNAVYDFFDRNSSANKNTTGGGDVVGGMRTQLRVYPGGTLPPQQVPQQIFKV